MYFKLFLLENKTNTLESEIERLRNKSEINFDEKKIKKIENVINSNNLNGQNINNSITSPKYEVLINKNINFHLNYNVNLLLLKNFFKTYLRKQSLILI